MSVPTRKQDDPIRAWKFAMVNGGYLFGVALSQPYELDDVAICMQNRPHLSPHLSCGCGFYAWKSRELALKQYYDWFLHTGIMPYVLLEVDLYGKVIQHELGYRASNQRVLAAWSETPVRVNGLQVRPYVP